MTFQGAYYSILCHDIQPFADPEAPNRLADEDPAYLEAFARTPYRDLCSEWGVETADPSVTEPVVSGQVAA